MPRVPSGPLLDDAAGPLVRPYTVSGGRTRPTCHFNLMTMVVATGSQPGTDLGPDHVDVLELCRRPVTVAEIAAHTRMPATVIKVLLSDLLEQGTVVIRPFHIGAQGQHLSADRELLEALLDGLLKRL